MTTTLYRLSLLGLLAGLSPTLDAQTTIVSYTFEDTTAAVIGSSISAVSWNSGDADGGYAGTFTNQGQALSVGSFGLSEYYQITLDATGYSDLVLNDFRTNAASGSAPKDWKISYSLTGISGTFTDVSTYTLGTSVAVGSTTIPGFTLPTGANNNGSIVLRLTATSSTRIDGTLTDANGTVRLDNLSITGTAAIPEPSTYAVLVAFAALTFRLWRTRARRA